MKKSYKRDIKKTFEAIHGKKYKAIGWVVEYQWNGKPKLIPTVYKTKAIAKWETATGASKKTFHRVYVEVK